MKASEARKIANAFNATYKVNAKLIYAMVILKLEEIRTQYCNKGMFSAPISVEWLARLNDRSMQNPASQEDLVNWDNLSTKQKAAYKKAVYDKLRKLGYDIQELPNTMDTIYWED